MSNEPIIELTTEPCACGRPNWSTEETCFTCQETYQEALRDSQQDELMNILSQVKGGREWLQYLRSI